jgi:hypothetical protein
MRVFKTKHFAKWAKKECLSDIVLRSTVKEMGSGFFGAELGGCVYKKRVPLPGRGKSGGARTILAFRIEGKAFFIFGYAKNSQETVSNSQLQQLQLIASRFLNYNDLEIEKALVKKRLIEVSYHE